MADKRKAPASQFYWGDWLRDKALMSCSLEAQGLWMRMLCWMHDNDPCGYLSAKGDSYAIVSAYVELLGVEKRTLKRLLAELADKGVSSTTPAGIIYSRRMVRDQELRRKRAEFGKLGGNPNLLNPQDNPHVNRSVNTRVNTKVNPKLTPAFAVAFTSKESIENASSVGEAHGQPDLPEQVGQGQNQTATATPNANGNGNHDKAASFESMVAARGKAAKLPAQPGETFQQWLERIKRAEALRKTGGSA